METIDFLDKHSEVIFSSISMIIGGIAGFVSNFIFKKLDYKLELMLRTQKIYFPNLRDFDVFITNLKSPKIWI